MGDKMSAYWDGDTATFMQEMIALCRKHKLVLLPTFENEVSLHDPMELVKWDERYYDYFKNRSMYDPDPSAPPTVIDEDPHEEDKE
jgi:hypothetical protein